MESHNQQLSSLSLDDGTRDWASLPLDLLKICLGAPSLDPAAKLSALATCKALARAAVRSSSHTMGVNADCHAPFARATRVWRELWGEEQPQQGRVSLLLGSRLHGTPERCLDELLSANQRMAFVTELILHVRCANSAASGAADGWKALIALLHARPWCTQGLSLNVVLPLGVSALLPNLQRLTLSESVLTPATRTSLLDAGCSRLQRLKIKALSAQQAPGAPNLQQLATAQLRQLANLPSLSSVEFKDASCPTLFLVALGTQLTCLHLDRSYRQCLPSAQTPTPAWRAMLQHVARCTRLRELRIPCATAEELGLVAPALHQLHTLGLFAEPVETDGDAVVEALLGLPHLTSLLWHKSSLHTIKRWHNDSQCRWENLTLWAVAPQLLARLPLHSLKQPVQWCSLVVLPLTPLRDVRAAVANVTRRCPAGFRWVAGVDGPPHLFLSALRDSEMDVPGMLRALQPLFAALCSFVVFHVEWDVPRVRALGEVLPRTCTDLSLSMGSVSREALEQVARSLPWVRCLGLREQRLLPKDVVAYVRLARHVKQKKGVGLTATRLEEVVVTRPISPKGIGEAQHKQAWVRAMPVVRQEGAGVVLKVVWRA